MYTKKVGTVDFASGISLILNGPNEIQSFYRKRDYLILVCYHRLAARDTFSYIKQHVPEYLNCLHVSVVINRDTKINNIKRVQTNKIITQST